MNASVPREAMPMGWGVPTIKQPRPKNAPPASGNVVSIDSPDSWSDKPSLPDQINEPEMCKVEKLEAKMFDLSKAEELLAYNALLTENQKPDTNILFRDHRVEAFPALGTWKVFVLVQTVKFRKIIQTRDPDAPKS